MYTGEWKDDKRNGKGTYIVSACRNYCKGYTKQELSKTISGKQKRHLQYLFPHRRATPCI